MPDDAVDQVLLSGFADAQRKRATIRNIAFTAVTIFAALAGLLCWNAEQQRKLAEEQREQADHILAGTTKTILELHDQMHVNTKSEVFTLFQTGAEHGNATLMRYLGLLYEEGFGVQQDYSKAREWYEKSADKGYARAMTSLGRLYDKGRGVPQNYVKAREWYEKAAQRGEERAMSYLGRLYDEGRGVAKNYAKAREWYGKAADKGEVSGMTSLGFLYGHGVSEGRADYAKAREWYDKAADKGDPIAMANLGVLYQNGEGVRQDYVKAREWYEKSADKGYAGAMFYLGLLYENGQGVAQSYGTAREWYGKSADKGYVRAILYLGGLYEKGQGVAQNYAKAREWYEKAADRGDPTAMANLGVLYQSGFGVEQDYGKARDWYKKAANKGDARATDRLEQLRKQMAADPNQPYLGEVPAGWPIFLVISVSIFSSSPILVPMPDLTTCQQAIVEAEREFNPIAADCSPPSRAAVLPSVISIIRAPLLRRIADGGRLSWNVGPRVQLKWQGGLVLPAHCYRPSHRTAEQGDELAPLQTVE